jgi:glutaredoxin
MRRWTRSIPRRSDRPANAPVAAGPVPRVTLYVAAGCHLCERARATVLDVRALVPFELAEVDITGDPELEARYRERLPVLEIDGRTAFVYHVPAAALRTELGAQARPPTASL